MPIIISVSNHNGEVFTNFQMFAIADFDNADNPEGAKTPLKSYCEQLDAHNLNYLVTESGMKGYHVWVFFDEPIHTKEVERFQNKIFHLCGFQFLEEQRWLYLPPDYDDNKHLDEQDHTIIETLTALGDGKMIKALFSMHPKNRERYELPYTLEEVLTRSSSDIQTEEEFIHAEKLIETLETNSSNKILEIAEISTPPLLEPAITRNYKKLLNRETRIRFKIPPISPEMDAKTTEMLNHILVVPCLSYCLDVSISQPGIYYLRANIVTTLANAGYTREEIGYLFREIINDDADNANRGELEKQVDYWFRKRYHCRCDYYQEVDNPKFCCSEPCGRRSPYQPEPEPTHIHLTRIKDFEPIYKICEELIDSKKPLVVCPKTTRAGFTTALNIIAKERNKKILYLVPRTSISEKTFKDTICLAQEKKGIFINGFVLSANQKACLVRMKEAIEYEKKHGKPMAIEIPIPREDCKSCQYRGTIVQPPPMTPLYKSDPEHNACMLETYRIQRTIFDSGFTTYAKIYAILNTPSEDAKEMLTDIEDYDIIVFDEITQFVEMTSFQIPIILKWREYESTQQPTYNYFAELNRDLEAFMIEKGLNETVEKIHYYCDLFIEIFADDTKYKHNEKIQNPLPTDQRMELRLNMITYLNTLYNYHTATDNGVKTIYNTLTLLCEEFWYAQKLCTMEHVLEINFLVPPRYSEVIKWVKNLNAQIIITDAVLPHQDLKKVFGPELEEFIIGDPQNTAETQLLVTDTRNIMPTNLFADEDRLRKYIHSIIEIHGNDKFLVVCPNITTAKRFIQMFPSIPHENVTWYRSNMTIGVACNLRVMVTLSTPYAPVEAFDWAATDIKGDSRESRRFWKANARNTFFQAIGRVKDPLAHVLSIVYTYGIKRSGLEDLLKSCQGKPNITEIAAMRGFDNVHTSVGDYWLRTGDCNLSPNETRVLTYFLSGGGSSTIARNINIKKSFVDKTISKLLL